jgi:hypothetical protein
MPRSASALSMAASYERRRRASSALATNFPLLPR